MAINPDRISAAQAKLAEDPHDVDSWVLLIKHCQCRSIDEARETYEELVATFPTSGRYWKAYIEQEIRARNYERVELLFQRCLIRVLSIELWKTYLLYVKETKASLTTYKEKMAQAYDFALDKMGLDIQSFSLWSDYIKFLKGVDAVGNFAENQKIAAIRKVYQRAVINPMINIETLWKDYCSFEQSINPMIAEKLTQERSRDYMNARRVAKEYEAVTRGLNKMSPSVPPTGNQEELKQVELWHSYINWEKGNPLKVEDPALVARRVMFAYEQSLLCLGHHPDIWYEAALFLQESSKTLQEKGDVDSSKLFLEQASQLFERAVSGVMKKCALLYFTYADFEEQNMKFEKVHKIYTDFLAVESIDPTLAYVQYMKFCRRAEGIKAARTVFKKAREDERSNFHVYVAAALMEYYSSKDKNVAFRIFDLGLRKFSSSTEFILAYLDYLSHLNEDNNTRVLFERVLTAGTLEPRDSLEVWNKFLEFETNIGDLASVVKVERRRAGILEEAGIAVGENKHTIQVIDRYKYMSLLPLTPSELRSIGYTSLSLPSSSSSLTFTNKPSSNSSAVTNGAAGVGAAAAVGEQGVPRPDTSQMVPFKPKVNWRPGEFMLPGGGFPLPPAAQELCQILPPPNCFHGPHVVVEKLCEVFLSLRLPDTFTPSSLGEGHSTKLFELAKSVQWEGGGKRRGRREDSEDEGGEAPSNDIYRKRMHKKIK